MEELVRKLRYESTWRDDYPEDKDMLLQAADAIEQLDKDLERSKEYEAFWEKEANEALRRFQVAIANKLRWIPVTERLPEDEPLGVRVLCCLTKKRRGWSWVDDRLFMDGKFWHPKGQKGKVTHWQPLPEPPKGETE